MSVLFRTAPTVERRDWGGPWTHDIPSPADAGSGSTRLSQFDALQVAAVVACVGLRSGAFAQLPLKAYRDVNGVATPLDIQPLLMTSPSDSTVPSVWKTQMSISRDLWGFALGYITAFDRSMYPTQVEWFDPTKITSSSDGGRIVWKLSGQKLDPSMVVHVPSRWVLPGNPVGMSPLEYSGLVDLSKRAQNFGRDWFRNGAVPSSILYSDATLTSVEADGILAKMKERWGRRQPAVIGAGMKYEAVSVNANESQFLETCRQAANDVAISFNMPPEKIGAAIAGNSITYANREQNQQQYLTDSINPDLVVVQESLDRHSPRGTYCKFSTGAFLRSDLAARYAAHEIGIRSRFLTPNEARALEEMGPLPGGDTFPAVAPAPATTRSLEAFP